MQSTVEIARPFGRFVSLAAAGAIALGMITGLSSSALAADDSITVTGSIAPTITLTLPVETIDHGDLTPNDTGTVGSGVTGVRDVNGANYTYTPGGQVGVQSNAAWSGTVDASLSGASLTTSDLSLVTSGGSSAFGAPLSFGTTTTGISQDDHTYDLRIDWTDTRGEFDATITYTVTSG